MRNCEKDNLSLDAATKCMGRVQRSLRLHKLPPAIRRIVLTMAGRLILGIGVMLVTPGPAFIVIPFGLLLPASEYEWARNALHKIKEWGRRAQQKWRQGKSRSGQAE